MIEVGVIGCDNLRAGELVRVLLNHPDVELKWVTASCPAATRLDQLVPSIVGETHLMASPAGEPADEADVVFLCGPRAAVAAWLQECALPQATRLIDLSGVHNVDHGLDKPWKYGLSEMQRRVLVHDARWVTVPGNAAAAVLLTLMPLARNLLLNCPLSARVSMGDTAFPGDGGRNIDGMDEARWTADQRQEIACALAQCQSSFNQPVELSIERHERRRTLAVEVNTKCGLDIFMVRQLFDQYYDDHNFVFIVDRPVTTADVENTNKCLITMDKDERTGVLTVKAVMDVLLKGCVGNAVHAMNLLFGLHEKVGLSLKGTGC